MKKPAAIKTSLLNLFALVLISSSIGFSQKVTIEYVWPKGAPVEMHIFQHGAHGFGLGVGKGAVSAWPELCKTWLKDLGMGMAQ